MFDGLIDIALDFRARLQEGGPFTQTLDSLKRRYPVDDGSELVADSEMVEAVHAFVDVKARVEALIEDRDRLRTIIGTRMGAATSMTGPDFRVTWKKSKDRAVIDWQNVAEGLLGGLTEQEREFLLSMNTRIEEGSRPLNVRALREPG